MPPPGLNFWKSASVVTLEGLQRLAVAVLGLDGLEGDDVAGVLRVLERERRGVRVHVGARALVSVTPVKVPNRDSAPMSAQRSMAQNGQYSAPT